MNIGIYEDYLVEIVDYNENEKQYTLRSFIGIRNTFPLPESEFCDKVITSENVVGKFCFIDSHTMQWYIKGIIGDILYLTNSSKGNEIQTFDLTNPKEINPFDLTNPKETNPKDKKETNPKDAIGIAKCPMSTLSGPVLMEMGLGMSEGALKYGSHNYREMGVSFRVYFDATMRHLWAAFEGEDIDPASGLSHITKAMTSLHVLRDAQIRGKCTDDRPRGTKGYIDFYNNKMKELIEKYPDPVKPYTANGNPPDEFRFV